MSSKFSKSLAVALLFQFAVGCSSPTKKTPSTVAGTGESIPPANITPGAMTFTAHDIEGKAFSINGDSVTARAIITEGDSRHPVAIDQNKIAYSSRRANLERSQVYEADLAKNLERRVSFDAGDAEPVALFGRRLVIASTSDEKKAGSRVLSKYLGAPGADDGALQHLLLEHPANGRKGTEWVRMSRTPAKHWIVSSDRDVKTGLALMMSSDVLAEGVYRIAIITKAREPETRAWSPLKVETPTPNVSVVDGRLFPDGSRIAWSNGSTLWTTNIKGQDVQRIGADSMPAAKSFTIDPTGNWIVFSTPSDSRGLNLMAIHRSGKCLKNITELPGDEIDPAFSPDGQTLFFALKQGDSHVVAKIPFGTSAQIAAACP